LKKSLIKKTQRKTNWWKLPIPNKFLFLFPLQNGSVELKKLMTGKVKI